MGVCMCAVLLMRGTCCSSPSTHMLEPRTFDADVTFPSFGSSRSYLEACMRLYPSAATTDPIFLSSGAEDYFLSASYFDEGEFVSPNAGLTFKDARGGIGAYKVR